jgi:hypothetical protein
MCRVAGMGLRDSRRVVADADARTLALVHLYLLSGYDAFPLFSSETVVTNDTPRISVLTAETGLSCWIPFAPATSLRTILLKLNRLI